MNKLNHKEAIHVDNLSMKKIWSESHIIKEMWIKTAKIYYWTKVRYVGNGICTQLCRVREMFTAISIWKAIWILEKNKDWCKIFHFLAFIPRTQTYYREWHFCLFVHCSAINTRNSLEKNPIVEEQMTFLYEQIKIIYVMYTYYI